MSRQINLSEYEKTSEAYIDVVDNYIPLLASDIVDFSLNKTFDSYMVFGIKIPRQVIEETMQYIKKNKNPLTDTIKRYPYIQLIVIFWMLNKMYELDKQYHFTQEEYTDIDEFQNKLSQYNRLYPFDIYNDPVKKLKYANSNKASQYDLYYICNQIKKLGGKSFKVKGENKILPYSAFDFETVMQYYKFEYFSLYDLIYDGLLPMTTIIFLELDNKSKTIFKINQTDFKYEEYNFKALYDTLKDIYKQADDKIIKLVCNFPKLSADNSLIVKSKFNEYYNKNTYLGNTFENMELTQGIAYNEAYELSAREIKIAQANKQGLMELYELDFKECALNLCPPYKGYKSGMPDGDEFYTYNEYENETGNKFYATHNFYAGTPTFHLHRYMLHSWSTDMAYGYEEYILLNKIYSYLYRKSSTYQMMCLMYINSYCR